MHNPDVTICLLTWNRAAFLEMCLRSLFASLSDEAKLSHEIIIMDNGSTDRTGDILDLYEGRPGVKIVRNSRNLGLNAYKKLFSMAHGRVIIEVDDDVLEFPKDFDLTMVSYIKAYPDYGYIGTNVIQNEKTDGARPASLVYKNDARGDMLIEEGPVGGWCAAFRRWHWKLLRPILWFWDIKMKIPEDALIQSFCFRIHKRIGIIRDLRVLHACGPVYAREFNQIDREIEKYKIGEREDLVEVFEKARSDT